MVASSTTGRPSSCSGFSRTEPSQNHIRKPEGHIITTDNGTFFYEYGVVDCQPKMVDGGTVYAVIEVESGQASNCTQITQMT